MIKLNLTSINLSCFAAVLLLIFGTHARADEGQEGIKVTQIVKTTQEWDGSPLPPYPSKNPEITILSYEIAPGTRLPMHKHPVINAGVMLQGKLTVITKEGKQLVLNPGDSIVELVNKWHYGVNQGSESVLSLIHI